MTVRTHHLKIATHWADAKLSGEKLFEIRFNDRDYQRGDHVVYRVVNPKDPGGCRGTSAQQFRDRDHPRRRGCRRTREKLVRLSRGASAKEGEVKMILASIWTVLGWIAALILLLALFAIISIVMFGGYDSYHTDDEVSPRNYPIEG